MPQHSPDATEPDIQAWCAAYLRTTLKLPDAPIDVHAEFASLGLDSAELVFLVAAIEDWLGLELASDTAMEYPTHRAIGALRRRPARNEVPRRADTPVASFERARFLLRARIAGRSARPACGRKARREGLRVRARTRRGAHTSDICRTAPSAPAPSRHASRSALPGVTARCSCSRRDWISSWRSSAASPRA